MAAPSPAVVHHKTKLTRLESEVDKYRADANWNRAVDLAKQFTAKSPGLVTLANLVVGESKLEEFIESHPVSDYGKIAPLDSDLEEARSSLHLVIKQDARPQGKLEATLLLAKLHYVRCQYNEALSFLDQADLENISVDNVSKRMMRIVAESYGLKALCIEKQPIVQSSKFKLMERENKILKCYERAGDLALLHLQELDKGQRTANAGLVSAPPGDKYIGHLLENSIQKTPLLYMEKGLIPKAVGRFRELLSAVETRTTQQLRQTLARQLAQVLLRGFSDVSYIPLVGGDERIQDSMQSKPRTYVGDRVYQPKDRHEEVLLLLLISECMANRNAVLTRSSEFSETRKQALNNVTIVYDLLTLSLVKHSQSAMLADILEKAMKFSFEEYHIWYEFALSLVGCQKYDRAVLILEECTRLKPENPTVYLQIADICYHHLHQIDKGIELSRKATALKFSPLLARSYLAVGVGYGLKAMEAKLRHERQELQQRSLAAYQKSYALDPHDHLATFHLALQLAITRQVTEGMKLVKEALRLKPDHLHSLHLLALLLSAQKRYDDALELIDAALEEHPDNLSLLFTKCKLELNCLGPEHALNTCKHMMILWKKLYQPQDSKHRGTGLIDRLMADKRPLTQLQLTELSDRDSGSVRAESIAASRVEQALSEIATSLNSSIPRDTVNQSWWLQAQIWLNLAELFLMVDKGQEAMACCLEAGLIFPLSHQVLFMKGRVHEHRLEFHEAKRCYDNSISINPANVNCLQHLGIVLHHLDQDKLAEKVLRDAVNWDPDMGQSWHCLGEVLHALGDEEAAAECLFTAVQLTTVSPVVPFSVIPRLLT